jgi:hypothetical protein
MYHISTGRNRPVQRLRAEEFLRWLHDNLYRPNITRHHNSSIFDTDQWLQEQVEAATQPSPPADWRLFQPTRLRWHTVTYTRGTGCSGRSKWVQPRPYSRSLYGPKTLIYRQTQSFPASKLAGNDCLSSSYYYYRRSVQAENCDRYGVIRRKQTDGAKQWPWTKTGRGQTPSRSQSVYLSGTL